MKAYQLKVMIKDSKPPIWRRIIVPAGLSFSQLTIVLNTVMEWAGYHLSSYTFNQLRIDLQEDDDQVFSDWAMYDQLDASQFLLSDFLEEPGVKSFIYTYDFGDNWEHQIQIEKVIEDYEYDYPVVLKYKGNSLIEDCGGIFGYYELLEILNNPNHPEYDEMRDWAGDFYDSAYDMEWINEELSKMKLLKKTTKPMNSSVLYEQRMKGKVAFLQVVPPENRFDYQEVWDDDFDEMSGFLDGLTEKEEKKFEKDLEKMFLITYADIVIKLKKNTALSEDEILAALEFEEDEEVVLQNFIKELEKQGL